jgi:hypothetical protein
MAEIFLINREPADSGQGDTPYVGAGKINQSLTNLNNDKEEAGVAAGLVQAHNSTFDHTKIATALQAESDPVFAAWLATNPLAGYLTSETDPVFAAWLLATPPVMSETDPVFAAWLATNPLASFLTSETDPVFAAWLATNPLANYVTTDDSRLSDSRTPISHGNEAHTSTFITAGDIPAETDPVFTAWDKSTGISITESQISDLKAYLLTETDPVFSISEAANFAAGDKNILDALRQLQVDQQDPTGFVDPSGIVVSYDPTGRTITLSHTSGFVDYYWKGEKKQLTSPWTSSVHADDSVAKYLRSTDGTNFAWSDTVWSFENIMVAYVPASRAFAVREPHGIWPYSLHSAWHYLFGTYRKSGGGLVAGTFALNTDTDAANNPSFAACIIADEDLDTSLPLWPENTYTHLWFTAAGTVNFSTTEQHVVKADGINQYAYVNTFDGTNFAFAPTTGTKFLNYYVIRIPVTSDAESQKYRAVILQPQTAYTSLTAAQAEQPTSLQLGN